MAFTTVASVRDVPPGKGKQVIVNGRRIALFNVGGAFHAIEDNCPHRGAPLSDGDLEGREVICSWHGARFDVATGANLSPPAPHGVAVFATQVVGDAIQIDA